MFEAFKSYLLHYRAERNLVIIVAVVILATILGSQLYVRYYTPKPIDPDIIARLQRGNAALRIDSTDGTRLDESENRKLLSYFTFNPNTLSDSGYAALGFSEREVGTLRKYLSKAGQFKYKEDFARLYFIDEAKFDGLEPYIDLPSKPEYRANKFQKSKLEGPKDEWDEPAKKWSETADTSQFYYKALKVDINKADTTEIKELKGIGSYFAKRIVQYREQLGGYYTIAQLLEIKLMSVEKIDAFAANVLIDAEHLRKIPVNRATAQELSAHPYVSFELANKIIGARESRKRFKDFSELMSTGLLNAELSVKLAPYLSFE